MKMKNYTILVIILFNGLFFRLLVAQDRMATVSGNCYLEDETDHSGIKVLFEAITPSAVTDSVLTSETGSYSIGLSEGIYSVHYFYNGFQPQTLPENYTFGNDDYSLLDVILSNEQTQIVSGEVSGEWFGNTTYLVESDITILDGDTLIIYPGATIKFMGFYNFDIYGSIFAQGIENDTITFTSGQPAPANGDWGKIRFYSIVNPSIIQHCDIGFGSGTQYNYTYENQIEISNSKLHHSLSSGINCEYSSPTITGNTIQNNYYGINGEYSSPTITGNTIIYNNYYGIFFEWDSSPTITSNTIQNNSSGIYLSRNSSPTIIDNIIQNCSLSIYFSNLSAPIIKGNTIQYYNTGIYCNGGDNFSTIIGNSINNGSLGIKCHNGTSPTIVGNTIQYNDESAINFEHFSHPYIKNNIITENNNGINAISSPEIIAYNNVWNNNSNYSGNSLPPEIGNLITTNTNGDACDTYSNISLDPMFVDIENLNIQADSPCIDAGDPESELDPDGTIADMGAFPYYQVELIPPDIDFTVSGNSGFSPFGVQFTLSNSGGPINNYLWNFGDGISSTLANPVHTYITEEVESFTVSLMASGPGGDASVTYENLITVTPASFPPVADFIASPLVGFSSVIFTSQSSGEITEYLWDFGDGETSNAEQPEHTYQTAGFYTISLTVTGPNGSDTETKENYIQILVPEMVVAGFTASSTQGVAPLTVAFENNTIGTVESYQWILGDGDTTDVESLVHIFENTGIFLVELIATGLINSDTVSTEIEVFPPSATIQSVYDVPNDQGGWVNISFQKSYYDTDSLRNNEAYSIEANYGDGWIVSASGNAYGEDQYTFQVHTQMDSSNTSDGLIDFRVIAGMDEGNFASETVQGYSVDNIVPSIPTGFTLNSQVSSGNVYLSWSQNVDEDFGYFQIQRNGELLIQTHQLNYEDNSLTCGTEYAYTLSAFDIHGNSSSAMIDPIQFGDFGDLDYDGLITISDVILMVNSILDIEPFDDCQADLSDINGDAESNITDIVLMVISILGEDVLSKAEEIENAHIEMFSDKIKFQSDGNIAAVQFEYIGELKNLSVSDDNWQLFENQHTAIILNMSGNLQNELMLNFTGSIEILDNLIADWNGNTTTGEVVLIPDEFTLSPAYPNPFNPVTTIDYSLPEHSELQLNVYNISGRLIETLHNGSKPAGFHTQTWNANALPSGVYILEMKAGEFSQTQKLLFLK